MAGYHTPVLLLESINGLMGNENGIYVDVTFGGGGHSSEILKRLKNGQLLAFDQDEDAEKNRVDDERFIFIRQNFRFMKQFLKYYGIPEVDGIIADLGISSHQINTPERGFSFRYNASLDLRMNRSAKKSAKEIINNYNETHLKRMFYSLGEIKNAGKLASVIVNQREHNNLSKTGNFIEAIRPCIPKSLENKYLAKVFQALRIEVNREIEFLEDFLLQSAQCLKKQGRLVVITYHSLEDRVVKNFIRSGNFEGKVEKDIYGYADIPFFAVNRRVITPGEDEINMNNRARSAKLRIAEKN